MHARVQFHRKQLEIDAANRYFMEMSAGVHTYQERQERIEAGLPCIGTVDAERDADFQAAYKEHCPGKKWPKKFDTAIKNLGEHAQPLIDKWKERYKRIAEEHHNLVQLLVDQLKAIAQDAEVLPAEEFILWKTIDEWDYHTQGFGAAKYARSSAQQAADDAIFYGLEAEVREVTVPCKRYSYGGWRSRGEYDSTRLKFEVWVRTDPLSLRIIENKPGVPLRDWIRTCWSRGVNPRVYAPMLPAGWEEEHGLDYFGNDLWAKKDAA